MSTYKTTRANKMRSRNGRPTSGHCIECGRLTSEDLGGIRVTIPSQANGVWVCEAHRGRRNLHGYSDENSNVLGTRTADGMSMSIELESVGYSTHARAYLVKNKFLPTSDCTVDIEYKSPIYFSEIPLAKIVGGVEYMDKNDSYKFSVNNSRCGIHTHYGFTDNHFNFNSLEYDYKELFYPLDRLVSSLSETNRIAIFGRTWGQYNRPCSFGYPMEHSNWINIQHENTLEIRMPRFTDAETYMRFVKCFKKIFKKLNTFYIQKCINKNLLDYRHRHDEVSINERKKIAIKTGIKLAKIFFEEYREYFPYTDEVINNYLKNLTSDMIGD